MLKMLGVDDEEVILKALVENNGDMEKTVDTLMSQMADEYGDEGETDQANK
jgi:CUE domain